MEQLVVNLTPEMLALVPIVAAILQVAKKIESLKKMTDWFPFFSVAVSYALCYFTSVAEPIIPSIIIGLVASGGYDLLKGTGK